jgi:hypothetical protein
LDATVLSAHVALCSGDDLESVKELALHPMDATVASAIPEVALLPCIGFVIPEVATCSSSYSTCFYIQWMLLYLM